MRIHRRMVAKSAGNHWPNSIMTSSLRAVAFAQSVPKFIALIAMRVGASTYSWSRLSCTS